MDITAGIVDAAPIVTSVTPIARRRCAGIFPDTSSPTPNASAARVATMRPNAGIFRVTLFISTVLSRCSHAAGCAREFLRCPADEPPRHPIRRSVALEELHRPLVLLRRRARFEGSEIPPAARLWILPSRIQAELH